jgi:hypothetical protein
MRRGYIMIEICLVLTLLMSLVVIVSLVVVSSHRQQVVMWDELVASEVAVSLLEQSRANKDALTTNVGRDVPLPTTDELSEILPHASAQIFVSAVLDADPDAGTNLIQTRVIVTWQRSADAGTHSVERQALRRRTP